MILTTADDGLRSCMSLNEHHHMSRHVHSLTAKPFGTHRIYPSKRKRIPDPSRNNSINILAFPNTPHSTAVRGSFSPPFSNPALRLFNSRTLTRNRSVLNQELQWEMLCRPLSCNAHDALRPLKDNAFHTRPRQPHDLLIAPVQCPKNY